MSNKQPEDELSKPTREYFFKKYIHYLKTIFGVASS